VEQQLGALPPSGDGSYLVFAGICFSKSLRESKCWPSPVKGKQEVLP
jgi:hypothetical protein